MKTRLFKWFVAVAFFLGSGPLFAQNNLVVNGDFEQGNTGFVSQYNYDPVTEIGEGSYCIDNTTSGHAGGIEWYPVVGYGGSGNFMLVNGFGNSVQTPQIVWKETVNVTRQTTYTFSCQLVNLNQGVFFFDPLPAIIQLKIRVNGTAVNVGESMSLNASSSNWETMTRTWNSGSYYGPIDIEIYDIYQSNPGLGDDFGLDHISFVPDQLYSVTANPDQAGAVCLNQSIDIDVLTNDDFQPNSNDVIVSVLTNPEHGTATMLYDNRIHYTFTDTNHTGDTDQFQYRVDNHGVTSDAWVTVTTNRAPTVGDLIPPEAICEGESFELTPPSVDDNGATITDEGWEIAPIPAGPFDPLTNSNIPFEYNGYYIRYKFVNTCGPAYSDAVPVTVYTTEPTFDTIIACDTYPWNGISCDHTDDYETTVLTAEGCETTAHLHFILNVDYYFEQQTEASCDEYLWPKTGLTYYETNVYYDTVSNDDPFVCDSIYALYLTINHAPEILSDIEEPSEICVGDTLHLVQPEFAMNHAYGGSWQWEYATYPEGPFDYFNESENGLPAGDYYLRFVVENNCDRDSSNVVPLRVNDKPSIQGSLSDMQVCEGSPLDLPELVVEWNNTDEDDRLGQWQLSPNGIDFAEYTYPMPMQAAIHDGCWLRFMADNVCGPDYLGPVRVSVVVADDIWDTIPACDSYVLPSGETITQSQTITVELDEPCPHTLFQYISVHYSDTVVVPVTSCHDEFVWHENTYERSDETQIDYWYTYNEFGCDRVEELHLDFDEYAAITENVTACDEYTWPRNGQSYTESTLDFMFKQGSGTVCDSMIYLNLTLGHTISVEGEPWTECAGFEWNGVSYNDDDVIYENLKNPVTHCDSIVSHQLTIVKPVDSTFYRTSCQPIWWYGQFCGEEGVYTHIIPSQQGCDSINLNMHFSIADEIVHNLDTIACAPIDWQGFHLEHDGDTCSYVFKTSQGCDSTVLVKLHLKNWVINTQLVSSCDADTINGVIYDSPGVYDIILDSVVGPNGCDINQIRLTIINSENLNLISGDSFVYAASNLLSGIYHYQIDTTGIVSEVTWTISNPDWRVLSSDENSCSILVTTAGIATLKATFMAACGHNERYFQINAGFFDVEDQQSVAVQVFPNPTEGIFTVKADGLKSIRVMDILGQTLHHEKCEGNEEQIIDLSAYAPSVYLLEVQTDKGRAMRRIVVCK